MSLDKLTEFFKNTKYCCRVNQDCCVTATFECGTDSSSTCANNKGKQGKKLNKISEFRIYLFEFKLKVYRNYETLLCNMIVNE